MSGPISKLIQCRGIATLMDSGNQSIYIVIACQVLGIHHLDICRLIHDTRTPGHARTQRLVNKYIYQLCPVALRLFNLLTERIRSSLEFTGTRMY